MVMVHSAVWCGRVPKNREKLELSIIYAHAIAYIHIARIAWQSIVCSEDRCRKRASTYSVNRFAVDSVARMAVLQSNLVMEPIL